MASIDYDFIEKHEKNELEAYVPVCTAKSVINRSNSVCYEKPVGSVIGRSGVTVAAGFDLGQINAWELRKMQLPKELESRLSPFVGIRKADALAADFKNLKLNKNEARLINIANKQKFIAKIETRFLKDSGSNFETLPPEIQTAIFSLLFQYGPNSMDKNSTVKKVWESLCKKDVEATLAAWEAFSEYKNRRTEEINLVKAASSKLPKS